jgi:hypothetical protein
VVNLTVVVYSVIVVVVDRAIFVGLDVVPVVAVVVAAVVVVDVVALSLLFLFWH